MSAVSPEDHNRETYDRLISLIENNQGALGLILVGCDDLHLRQRLIDRYEAEAKQANIQPFRVVLGSEPSLRSGLDKLRETEPHLREGREAVVTVTGAEWLLRVKLRSEDEQSDLDKFFGYLQWTREGLREFRYPIVLWVTRRILREMSVRAPDFWSWRKAVLRFAGTEQGTVEQREPPLRMPPTQPEEEDSLPPLEELLAEIHQLESSSPESANLATLYDQLGRVYARRISQGKATNLDAERQGAIDAFQKAIDQNAITNHQAASVATLTHFGNFLDLQSRYEEAISAHRKALAIAREIGDRHGEAKSLNGLGNAYYSLGQYQRAIDFHQQSLEIEREIGNRRGEAASLGNLGSTYGSLGQYQRAIDFHQQSLEIKREIGDRHGEAASLGNLGSTYGSLGQYQRAIDFHQQSLEIKREIGNRRGEAASLGNLGSTYGSLGQYQRAIDFYQQSLEINREIGDRHGEAASLGNLGSTYGSLGQYQRAIDFYQQSLEINREIGDRQGEAVSLIGLGSAYYSLGQYQRAIDFYQQSLEINREIGDRQGEANSWFNKALALAKFEARRWEAITAFRQAKEIFADLKLDHKVENCDNAIYSFNQNIALEPQKAPPLNDNSPAQPKQQKRLRFDRPTQFLLWCSAGIAIVLLVAWLRSR